MSDEHYITLVERPQSLDDKVHRIVQDILVDVAGQGPPGLNLREELSRAARHGFWLGQEDMAQKTCMCPEWLPREEGGHVYDVCPFYCDECNYDRHQCHGCGEELSHDNAKGHDCT